MRPLMHPFCLILRFNLQYRVISVNFVTFYVHKFYRCQKLGLQHVKNIIEIISRLLHTDRMWKGIVMYIFFSKNQVMQV